MFNRYNGLWGPNKHEPYWLSDIRAYATWLAQLTFYISATYALWTMV
jgi:hypothetical protein